MLFGNGGGENKHQINSCVGVQRYHSQHCSGPWRSSVVLAHIRTSCALTADLGTHRHPATEHKEQPISQNSCVEGELFCLSEDIHAITPPLFTIWSKTRGRGFIPEGEGLLRKGGGLLRGYPLIYPQGSTKCNFGIFGLAKPILATPLPPPQSTPVQRSQRPLSG